MKTPAPLSPASRVRLLQSKSDLAAGAKLRAYDWAVFFALEDGRTLGETAARSGFELAALLAAAGRIEAAGLLEEPVVSLSDYLRAAGEVGDERPIGVAEFLRAALPPSDSEPSCPEETTRSAEPAPSGFEPLVIDGDDGSPWDLEEGLTMNEESVGSEALSLRAILDFLMSRATDAESGQLDVYRTFLRIDSALLRRNGITTLDFDDDRWVSDPALIDAILESVTRTAGAVPREAFVSPPGDPESSAGAAAAAVAAMRG
jgi:hypothetical protein